MLPRIEMLMRRSFCGGCGIMTRGDHRRGRENIVPSVEARSLNGTFVTSVELLFVVFDSTHERLMKNERRFSI